MPRIGRERRTETAEHAGTAAVEHVGTVVEHAGTAEEVLLVAEEW